ncbi:adenylate/guanylate cyclase domain-containing protein [Pokkaliibacter sp. CJK22405]|uniref:adenylate/guanylate cyclase domain-containing protein n=1 Tax=Pokkaliibacter sp. CJK22405 TaxID=3384615 RepID=UPI003984E7D8
MTPDQFRLLTSGMAHFSGWPVLPVLAELMLDTQVVEPKVLVTRVCESLARAGAGLQRIRIGLNVLHPEVIGRTYTWWRGSAEVEETSAMLSVKDTSSYIGSPIEALNLQRQPIRYRLSEIPAEDMHIALSELKEQGATDYIGFPMVYADGRVQTAMFCTDAAEGFSREDIEKLALVVAVLEPHWEVIARQELCESLLSTYIGPRIAQRVMKGQIRRGDMEEIQAALWFSDLRDFTFMTEHQPADQMLDALNAYFETVAEEVTSRGGEILRFIGDAMLIVFPVSEKVDLNQAAALALEAAQATLARIEVLSNQRQAEDLPPLRFGLGLHVGRVQYGNVGAPSRLDFTVLGPAVNRTARIEDTTKRLGYPLLISAEMASLLSSPLQSVGTHAFRGIDEPMELFIPMVEESAIPAVKELG